MTREKDNVLVVFAKKPEMGRVKTRIANETSPRLAYEVAKSCLQDLINNLRGSDFYDIIVACENRADLAWFEKTHSVMGLCLGTKDLNQGEKFTKVFGKLLHKDVGYKRAILVPMDIPFISSEEIVNAFIKFEKKRYVLGPEINGGVYLIGMSDEFNPGSFANVPWSTPDSFDVLLNNLGEQNTFVLRHQNDLNYFQDILSNRDIISHSCPNLYNLLEKEGYYLPEKDRYVNFDDLPICIPAVSAIVERKYKGKDQILIQMRNKPAIDPLYSGLWEIPSGLVNKYESAEDAVVREVREETGLKVGVIAEQPKVYKHQSNKEKTVALKPFCCNQQLEGGRSYIGMVFRCSVVGGTLAENPRETSQPEWINLDNLKDKIYKKKKVFFPLNIPVLKQYLEYKKIK